MENWEIKEEKLKVIDAHCHLPKTKSVDDLIRLMDESDVEKSILILNTKEDQEAIQKQISSVLKNKHRLGIAVGYDLHIPGIDAYIAELRECGLNIMIKLHSRIMKYTLHDIPTILSRLHAIDFGIIMVDGFDYGHHLENLINLELLVATAEEFPDKKVVFAHAGGINILKSMLCTRTLSNVYYDLSLTVPYLFETSIYKDIKHFLRFNYAKTMFGSDYPDFTVNDSKLKFDIVMNELNFSLEIMNDVFYHNAAKIYCELF